MTRRRSFQLTKWILEMALSPSSKRSHISSEWTYRLGQVYEQLESFAFSIPIGPDLNIYKTTKPASNVVSKITISLDEEGTLHMENLERNFSLVKFYQEKEDWKKSEKSGSDFPKEMFFSVPFMWPKGIKGWEGPPRQQMLEPRTMKNDPHLLDATPGNDPKLLPKEPSLLSQHRPFVTSAWQISELLWISDFYVSLITLLECECLLHLSLSAPLCA